MAKKFFSILFIFLMCFFAIDSVKAEGHFKDSEGNTGNVLRCEYTGTDGNGVKRSEQIICTRRSDRKVTECSADNHSGKPDSSLGEWVDAEKRCPTAVAAVGTKKSNGRVTYKFYYGSAASGSATREKYNDCIDKNGGACGTVESYGGAVNRGTTEEILENTKTNINVCFCYWEDLSKMEVLKSKEEAKDANDATEAKDANDATEAQIDILNKYAKEKNESQTQSQFSEFEDGCGILGEDIAYFLRKTLFFASIIGVALTIVLGAVDFIGAVTGASDDGMKKAWKKFIRRIIALAILIILPALVVFVLTEVDVKGVNEDSILCDVADE